jgi:DNA-binding GntR family transcriptional regulator
MRRVIRRIVGMVVVLVVLVGLGWGAWAAFWPKQSSAALREEAIAAEVSSMEAMVMLALDQHDRPLHVGLGIGMDVEPSAIESRRIVEAIHARDPEQARLVMREHIMRGEERIAAALDVCGD